MIDKTTLEAISQGPAIDAADRAISGPDTDFVALPDNFEVHDLEKFRLTRRRARGKMTTPSIDNFGAYVAQQQEPGAAVFVDADAMHAVAVLNLGSPDEPGHADNLAVLKPKKTAAYAALTELLQKSKIHGLSQRELAEFMEDWAQAFSCFDAQGGGLETKRALDAVRRITIESARTVESQEKSLSSERSVMESVAASSKAAPLPAILTFACVPYNDLAERSFAMRLSIRTGDAAKPALTLALHAIRGEVHAEEMARELADSIKESIAEAAPVYLGVYAAA